MVMLAATSPLAIPPIPSDSTAAQNDLAGDALS